MYCVPRDTYEQNLIVCKILNLDHEILMHAWDVFFLILFYYTYNYFNLFEILNNNIKNKCSL